MRAFLLEFLDILLNKSRMILYMNKDREAKFGRFYGYPECCIKSFLEKSGEPYWYEKHLEKYPKARAAMNNCGFIPCEAHLAEIEDGKTMLKDLIANRKEKLDFPNSFENQILEEEHYRARIMGEHRFNLYLQAMNFDGI